MSRFPSVFISIVGCCVTLFGCQAGSRQSTVQPLAISPPRAFGGPVEFVLTERNVSRLVFPPPKSEWSPSVNPERWRSGETVFQRVAPAVVVVRTRYAHGTGFFIDENGRIVTNNHVIDEGLFLDEARQASYALIYTGDLRPDGTVERDDEPLRAYLCCGDERRDLALLLLDPDAPGGEHSGLTLASAGPESDKNALS